MILTFEQLKEYRKTVAMVDGAFDPLHRGHIEYFRAAAEQLGVPLLCNVASDRYVWTKHPPLLPEDQPADPTRRLMVRPGITGWAQVNGGKQITSEEKEDLDEWYIRNASPLLDLRILLLTCRYIFFGNRASGPNASAKLRGSGWKNA